MKFALADHRPAWKAGTFITAMLARSALASVALTVPVWAGQFPAGLPLSSLDGSNGFQINGEVAGDESGFSVASAEDVNGDGFADLIIGSSSASPGGIKYAGSSYVVFGKPGGFTTPIDLSTLNGSNGFRLDGVAAYDYSGWSVASAGDVNGDGFADLIVGAQGADPGGKSYAGSSYVVFGKASGFAPAIDLSTLNGSNGFRLDGVAARDYSGLSVASAGDVNGDGFADLILLANGADPGGKSYAGSSYVVFGKASGFAPAIDLSTLNGSNGFRLDGVTADDESGRSVASAGDVNGDGLADLIIGAFGASPGGKGGAGSSYVVFGRRPGTIPVDGLPDYNATYFGTPYTGSRYKAGNFMFSTLYRDNYRRTWNDLATCAGEGCGSHAGVDIRVPSNTPVRAAFDGTIYKSACINTSNGPGGLIVIEANNPVHPAEKIYVSYMHLRSRTYADGTPVKVGDQVVSAQAIGHSGGDPNNPLDVCNGASQQGPHLHFQIDKQWGGPYPFYPGKADRPDNLFAVLSKTYDPLVFVKRLWNWNFEEKNSFETADKELWASLSATATGVANGALWLDGNTSGVAIERGADIPVCSVFAPSAPCTGDVSVQTDVTPNLYVQLAFRCKNNPGTVSAYRSDKTWASANFVYQRPNTYKVSLKNLALADGIITKIKIKPSNGCSATSPQFRFKKIVLAP